MRRRAAPPIFEVKPRIVLPEGGAEIEDRPFPVRQHDFEAKQAAAHVAIAQETSAAGIGRDHATDRGIGAEIDREGEVMRRRSRVQRREKNAGVGVRPAVDGIDHRRPVEPVEAEHRPEAVIGRKARTDEPGASALRNQRNAKGVGGPDQRRDFGGRGWTEDDKRPSPGRTAVRLIGGPVRRVGKDVARAHNAREVIESGSPLRHAARVMVKMLPPSKRRSRRGLFMPFHHPLIGSRSPRGDSQVPTLPCRQLYFQGQPKSVMPWSGQSVCECP